jgi:hypothetical protein
MTPTWILERDVPSLSPSGCCPALSPGLFALHEYAIVSVVLPRCWREESYPLPNRALLLLDHNQPISTAPPFPANSSSSPPHPPSHLISLATPPSSPHGGHSRLLPGAPARAPLPGPHARVLPLLPRGLGPALRTDGHGHRRARQALARRALPLHRGRSPARHLRVIRG